MTARGEAGAFDAEEGAVATTPAPACGWMPAVCGVRSAPIRAKTATAEAATRTPVRQAEASDREIRCRPGRPPPPGSGWSEAASVSARRSPAPPEETTAEETTAEETTAEETTAED